MTDDLSESLAAAQAAAEERELTDYEKDMAKKYGWPNLIRCRFPLNAGERTAYCDKCGYSRCNGGDCGKGER